jgi:hypothetical protein
LDSIDDAERAVIDHDGTTVSSSVGGGSQMGLISSKMSSPAADVGDMAMARV